MRSQFVDKFNHDDEATGYDEDVADEGNPIREGYAALLRDMGRTREAEEFESRAESIRQ